MRVPMVPSLVLYAEGLGPFCIALVLFASLRPSLEASLRGLRL